MESAIWGMHAEARTPQGTTADPWQSKGKRVKSKEQQIETTVHEFLTSHAA